MTKDLEKLVVNKKSSLKDALRSIDKNAKGLVFVINNTGRMVGILTDGDVRRWLLKSGDLNDSITKMMNENFVFAREDDSIEKIYKITRKNKNKELEYIPILNKEGKIIDYFHFAFKEHIPVARPNMGGKEFEYVAECILTNWISSQGKFVKSFEAKMAQSTGVKYAAATSNGTVALHLALEALGIGQGDEVIVPTLTFIATANAVSYTGAKPVFVDSEEDTWCMDPALIEKLINKKTKAIIPVHLYGQPCRMGQIMKIAKRHKLYVIEDAAEAQGAYFKNKKVGAIGDIGCFSFFGNKVITTGEGGMVVTNNKKIYEKMIMLRDHGMSRKRRYWHPVIGYNYRMTNIQAAIGCAQLERIDYILREKEKIRELYNKYLFNEKGIVLPPTNKWSENICWMYSVLINQNRGKSKRDKILAMLNKYYIECRPLFNPIHIMPPYFNNKKYKVAEKLSRRGISLPSYVGLKEEEIKDICKIIIKGLS